MLLGTRNLVQGQWNTADYAPATINNLISAGLAANTPGQRFTVYSKLLGQLASDVPYVPICAQDYAIALSPKFSVSWYTANFAYGDYHCWSGPLLSATAEAAAIKDLSSGAPA